MRFSQVWTCVVMSLRYESLRAHLHIRALAAIQTNAGVQSHIFQQRPVLCHLFGTEVKRILPDPLSKSSHVSALLGL